MENTESQKRSLEVGTVSVKYPTLLPPGCSKQNT